MTMPPFTEDPEASRPYFARLAELAAERGLERLSMGTSQDWQVAVEEGATIVRLGSAALVIIGQHGAGGITAVKPNLSRDGDQRHMETRTRVLRPRRGRLHRGGRVRRGRHGQRDGARPDRRRAARGRAAARSRAAARARGGHRRHLRRRRASASPWPDPLGRRHGRGAPAPPRAPARIRGERRWRRLHARGHATQLQRRPAGRRRVQALEAGDHQPPVDRPRALQAADRLLLGHDLRPRRRHAAHLAGNLPADAPRTSRSPPRRRPACSRAASSTSPSQPGTRPPPHPASFARC